MRPIKNFEEYVEEQIVSKHTPDKSRANNLKNEGRQCDSSRNRNWISCV